MKDFSNASIPQEIIGIMEAMDAAVAKAEVSVLSFDVCFVP